MANFKGQMIQFPQQVNCEENRELKRLKKIIINIYIYIYIDQQIAKCGPYLI